MKTAKEMFEEQYLIGKWVKWQHSEGTEISQIKAYTYEIETTDGDYIPDSWIIGIADTKEELGWIE